MSAHAEPAADAAVRGVAKRTDAENRAAISHRPSVTSLGALMAVQLAWIAAVSYVAYRIIGFVGGLA